MNNQPTVLSTQEFLDVLDDIRTRVESGDSWEGSLEYRFSDQSGPGRDFEVCAAYRVGNTGGQGGMRIIASGHSFEGYELEEAPASFVGKTVTLAGKDPLRWEQTTITGYDPKTGHLLLAGGHLVTGIFDPEPTRTPVTTDRVRPWDIARGIVHL